MVSEERMIRIIKRGEFLIKPLYNVDEIRLGYKIRTAQRRAAGRSIKENYDMKEELAAIKRKKDIKRVRKNYIKKTTRRK